MNINSRYPLTLAACLCTATPALADSPKLELSLGLGVAATQSIYSGVDTQTDALPLFELQYGNFYLEGLEAGYTLIENDTYSLAVAISGDELDGERTESSQLNDLGDVDSGVNLKLGGELYTDFGLLGASIAQDVSNEHEGTEISLNWAAPLEVGDAMVMPGLFATWMSDDLVNHYYGIKTSQVKAGRPAYSSDASWRYGLEVMGEYPLAQQWTLMGGITATWYGDEVSDSPIVEDDHTLSGFLGVKYRF